MNPPPDPRAEVHEICDRLFDGEFTPADRERLEALVLGDVAARRAYIEYVQVHAALSEARLKDMPLSEVVNLEGASEGRMEDGEEWKRREVAAVKQRWVK